MSLLSLIPFFPYFDVTRPTVVTVKIMEFVMTNEIKPVMVTAPTPDTDTIDGVPAERLASMRSMNDTATAERAEWRSNKGRKP